MSSDVDEATAAVIELLDAHAPSAAGTSVAS
jgi:hypothetical protein